MSSEGRIKIKEIIKVNLDLGIDLKIDLKVEEKEGLGINALFHI